MLIKITLILFCLLVKKKSNNKIILKNLNTKDKKYSINLRLNYSMKLDKQISDLKSKYNHLNEQLMNSENLDNKQIIQINKDLSKLEPIISLSDDIKKLENEIEGYKEILENENDEELRSLAKQELPIYEKDLDKKIESCL